MKIGSFFKNEKYKKIIVGVLVFLIALLVLGLFTVRAEDNKTRKVVLKEWTTQLLYDTTNACYQGTIKWIFLSNPALRNAPAPGWRAQRQMIEHCFCVMDRIRKEIKIEEYQKRVFDQAWTGNLFLTKALECVKEEKTLPSFFTFEEDEEIKTIPNEPVLVVPDGETNDPQEESPDQKQEESEGSPQTIFQG